MKRKFLQYVSDIHLETRYRYPRIPITNTYLALIGDIGNPFQDIYKDFLHYTVDNCERVFLVAGNHEYYNKQNYEKVNDRLMKLSQDIPRLEYLVNSKTDLENYTIIGSTLWTPVYKNIHYDCVNFLENEINNSTKPLIILTHYLPSYKMITEKYLTKEYDDVRNRYATSLDHLIKAPVKAWLSGHSHCNSEILINGIPCCINALGHEKNERCITRVISLT